MDGSWLQQVLGKHDGVFQGAAARDGEKAPTQQGIGFILTDHLIPVLMVFGSPCWVRSHSVASPEIWQVSGQQEFQNVLQSVSAPVKITALEKSHFCFSWLP